MRLTRILCTQNMYCKYAYIVLLNDGVYHAINITTNPVSSYLNLFTLTVQTNSGIFSVALSLRLLSPDVIRHHCSVKPGLSSAFEKISAAAIQLPTRQEYTQYISIIKPFLKKIIRCMNAGIIFVVHSEKIS